MTLTATNWRTLDAWSKARLRWRLQARPEQLRPAVPHLVWFYMAGRGAGKTRSGAEDVSEFVRTHPGALVALVAPTFGGVRDTMVEGESGILRVLPPSAMRGGNVEDAWNRSTGELYFANGAEAQAFSSEKPGRLRGPQHHHAWVDEPAEMADARRGDDLDTTWNNLMMGLRLGDDPKVVVTGTPKRVLLVRQLLAAPSTVVTRGSTYDNLANLAPAFRAQVLASYEGTRIGRQELMGELLEDVEGALWRRDWIEAQRRPAPPPQQFVARTVVALDPSDGLDEGDEQAVVVAQRDVDGRFYVLHSDGMRVSPASYLAHAAELYRYFKADRVVYEKNHGGRYLTELLHTVAPNLPTRAVDATVGKRTRAEPISALYEQGRVSHVGSHDVLEDQMCVFTGAPGDPSPDRLDALVWALTDLSLTTGRPTLARARPSDGAPGSIMGDILNEDL